MKIVVFIKQVPDNTRLRFQDGQLVTEGIPVMMNPFDEYALETAIRLKEQAGGESDLTTISLGGAGVKETLKKAIAAGADQGVLLSDPLFEGGDSATVATALAAAVRKQIPDFDVLVFGQAALDDAAAQVGPHVAALLAVPSLTFVNKAILENGQLLLSRETIRGLEEWRLDGPGALCVMKCEYELRSSNIKGVMKANKADIPIFSAADLDLDATILKPKTTLVKSWQRPAKSEGKVIDGTDAQAAVAQLLDYLHEAHLV
jgi:electron transfer flavoprotein alpha/beta subunit